MNTPQPRPAEPLLYATIFLLSITEFLQAGMTAFAAAPLMGEISIGPEEFSGIAAVYASLAILAISMQRWFVERIGGRRFIQWSALLSITGSTISATSVDLHTFLIGRAVMALGGGIFFTASRMIIHHGLAGPKRFVGIRCLATGVALGIAAAPWLASLAVSQEHWSAMYWLIAGLGVTIFLLAGFALPHAPVQSTPQRSQARPGHQLLLVGASFLLLYSLQRFYYDFYGNVPVTALAFLGAIAGLALYLRRQHGHAQALLRLREILSPRYLFGLGVFFFAYLMFGANNYAIQSMLLNTLGYGWATIGRIQALGLGAALLTWWVMERVMPRRPAPRKFLVTGFAALAVFGLLLSRMASHANLWTDVLPALACNSIFLLTVLPTAAMQTFRETEHNESLFSHAQQLKNMMAQAATALGISMATIGQQWRVAVHYTQLTEQITPSNPVYTETIQHLQEALASTVAPAEAGRLALAQVAQMLAQQSAMLANIEHFSVITGLGMLGVAVAMGQKVFR